MNKKSRKRIIAGSVVALGLVFVSSGAIARADFQPNKYPKGGANEHQNLLSNKLNQAITDGKLTQEQVNLILVKRTEMKNNNATLQNKTREERQLAISTMHTELLKWAEDNNIPSEYIMPFGKKMKGRHGEGHGFGHKMMDQMNQVGKVN